MRRTNSERMNSKIFLVIGMVFVVSAASVFILGATGDQKKTVTGQFLARDDCTGVVQGTLITDYGISGDLCGEVEKYEGKVVEVTGWVYSHECSGENCLAGPHMRNIESIKILG